MGQSPSWVLQVVKFPAFHGTLRFITLFTGARHLSLPWARSIQSVPRTPLLEINLNIIFPTTPRSSMWSLSLRSPHQNPVCVSAACQIGHMPCPSHSSFDRPNSIWRGVQIMGLLALYSSPFPCYLVPLRPKYILSTVLSNTLNLLFIVSVRVQVSHSYKTTGEVIFVYVFIPLYSYLWTANWETKYSVPNDSKHSMICLLLIYSWTEFHFV